MLEQDGNVTQPRVEIIRRSSEFEQGIPTLFFPSILAEPDYPELDILGKGGLDIYSVWIGEWGLPREQYLGPLTEFNRTTPVKGIIGYSSGSILALETAKELGISGNKVTLISPSVVPGIVPRFITGRNPDLTEVSKRFDKLTKNLSHGLITYLGMILREFALGRVYQQEGETTGDALARLINNDAGPRLYDLVEEVKPNVIIGKNDPIAYAVRRRLTEHSYPITVINGGHTLSGASIDMVLKFINENNSLL